MSEAADWARVVQGPVEPAVEDAAFLAKARDLLPETVDADTWKAWTDAVKAETGAKGRGLYMPLRKALTGLDHGPEMGPMLALIGREKAVKRLSGEAGVTFIPLRPTKGAKRRMRGRKSPSTGH